VSARVSCRLLTRAVQKVSGSAPRAALLLVLGAGGLMAGGLYPSPNYVYDGAAWAPGGSTTNWQANGGASFGSSAITFGSGGSVMSTKAVSGVTTDYEVKSQMTAASGANYVQFVRASSTSVVAGSGSYISVELNVLTYTGSPASVAATLNVNQCVSGTVTTISSTSATVLTGSTNTLRTVVYGQMLWVIFNGQWVWSATIPTITAGQPGVGAYGAHPGSFTQVSIGHRDSIAPLAIDAEPVASSVLPTSTAARHYKAT
jgi:hypothetical protein